MSTHATLSPSAAARWVNCAGSVRLIQAMREAYPELVDRSSPAADEGTLAHALLERALIIRRTPLDVVTGTTGVHYKGVTATPEMANHLKDLYYYALHQLAQDEQMIEVREEGAGLIEDGLPTFEIIAERRVDPGVLINREDTGGTADITRIFRGLGLIEIVDLKYGAGNRVEVSDNIQLILYGLGVLGEHVSAFDGSTWIKTVRITIAQPRMDHEAGKIRSIDYDVEDLLTNWVPWLAERAAATDAADAPCTLSAEACKWCEAKPLCPEQRAGLFEVLHVNNVVDIKPEKLSEDKDWSRVPMEEIEQLLPLVPMLQAYLGSLQDFATNSAIQGHAFEGLKLVRKVTRQRWAKPETEIVKKLRDWKFRLDDIYTQKLKTPKQIDQIAQERLREVAYGNFKSLIEKPEGALTLVPEGDNRREAKTATTLFETVETDETEKVREAVETDESVETKKEVS